MIASSKTWLESDAVQQLEATARLPGMRRAVGMPDLHPGKGAPIGAVFACSGWVYPYLIGNDIGCGMALYALDLQRREAKLDRWEKRLDLEGSDDGSLGTIGLGNHFAEIQAVESTFSDLLPKDRLTLLVHSGSRSLGEVILRAHVDRFANAGLSDDTPEQEAYLAQHDEAVAWAHRNRSMIAARVLDAISAEGELLFDVAHNTVERSLVDGEQCWLHRKGATPADRGPVVIAGSRGTLSYVVMPTGDGQGNLCTLAHGAGRKWKRSEARGRLEDRYRAADLLRTPLGSRVICEDKDLLYEEAPQAYKDIDRVVADLVEAGACTVLATLRPLLTYKTRSRGR